MTSGSATAVVVAYDSAHALPDCLRALAREGVPAIVVDNASSDGSADVAAALGARVLRNARNEGYGRANNLGAQAAESAFLLVVNPDVMLDPGAAAALLAAAERYPDAGLFAPRLVEPDGRFFFQPRSLLSPYLENPGGRLTLPEGDACAPFLSGACLLIRRAPFLELGGFDPDIFLFYEDDDLCRRMADAGHALVHVHAAVARHGRGRSSAPRPGRVFRGRWHQAWSRAYVARKYGLPDPAPAHFALNALRTLGAGLTLNRRLIERYAGSAAGAWAAMTGATALAREGLDRKAGRGRSPGGIRGFLFLRNFSLIAPIASLFGAKRLPVRRKTPPCSADKQESFATPSDSCEISDENRKRAPDHLGSETKNAKIPWKETTGLLMRRWGLWRRHSRGSGDP